MTRLVLAVAFLVFLAGFAVTSVGHAQPAPAAPAPPGGPAAAPATPAAPPDAPPALGGPGESCRSRTDCAAGLKCIAATCVAAARCTTAKDCGHGWSCADGHCTPPPAETSKLDKTHPFAGVTFVGGPSLILFSAKQGAKASTVDPSGAFAFRGGVFLGRNELALEIAPSTYFWDTSAVGTLTTFRANGTTKSTPFSGSGFEMSLTYARYARIWEGDSVQVYWPFRFGPGFLAGSTNTFDDVFFEVRVEIASPSVKIGPVMVDLHVPSIRYFLTNSSFLDPTTGTPVSGLTAQIFNLEFGASASWLF